MHQRAFWEENGLRKSEVFYQKNLKRTVQLDALEEAISKPTVKIAGIVVDMIDEIVHGAALGKRGVTTQISEWCETGFVERLLQLLASHGYRIYLTSDHGNVETVGVGRINQGAISESRGERVRVYRNANLISSVPHGIDAFRFVDTGLPNNFLPLYAAQRSSFVPCGEHVVSHGGMSVEEVIVPFVRIFPTGNTS